MLKESEFSQWGLTVPSGCVIVHGSQCLSGRSDRTVNSCNGLDREDELHKNKQKTKIITRKGKSIQCILDVSLGDRRDISLVSGKVKREQRRFDEVLV